MNDIDIGKAIEKAAQELTTSILALNLSKADTLALLTTITGMTMHYLIPAEKLDGVLLIHECGIRTLFPILDTMQAVQNTVEDKPTLNG